MQRMSHLILVGIFALGLNARSSAAQASLSATDSSSRAVLRDSLNEAKQRWEAARSFSYRVRVDYRCECARPLDNAVWVFVRGDSIQVDSTAPNRRYNLVNVPNYFTVDGMFRELDAALSDTLVDVRGARFDSERGFPLSFAWFRRCVPGRRCISGDFSDVRVLGFEVVR